MAVSDLIRCPKCGTWQHLMPCPKCACSTGAVTKKPTGPRSTSPYAVMVPVHYLPPKHPKSCVGARFNDWELAMRHCMSSEELRSTRHLTDLYNSLKGTEKKPSALISCFRWLAKMGWAECFKTDDIAYRESLHASWVLVWRLTPAGVEKLKEME